MYFCKNCGVPYMTDEAVMCVKCGARKGLGSNFCHSCGTPVDPSANICMTCGVELKKSTTQQGTKSKVAAGILGIFLGCFGVHNFYLGYTAKAVIQLLLTIFGILLSCIFVGVFLVIAAEIWGFIEGILILTGTISTDAQGNLLTN